MRLDIPATDSAFSRDADLYLLRLANTNTLAECQAIQLRIDEARKAQYARAWRLAA
jgi:hypothetical protein